MAESREIRECPPDTTHGRGFECESWHPPDRPAQLWCKACDTAVSLPSEDAADSDLRLRYHLSCRVAGALVWVWGTPAHARRSVLARALPHCGDANCTGLCMDPECIPVENKTEIQLSQRVQKLEQMCVEKSDALIRMTSLRNYIFAALIVSLLTQLSLIAKFMAQ